MLDHKKVIPVVIVATLLGCSKKDETLDTQEQDVQTQTQENPEEAQQTATLTEMEAMLELLARETSKQRLSESSPKPELASAENEANETANLAPKPAPVAPTISPSNTRAETVSDDENLLTSAPEAVDTATVESASLDESGDMAEQTDSDVEPAVNLEGYAFFGDPSQPGYQVQVQVFTRIEKGEAMRDAVNNVLDDMTSQAPTTAIAVAARQLISADRPLSNRLVLNIAQVTNLGDATSLAVAEMPQQVSDIVTLGVTLYPDYAQEVLNAAAASGEISGEDALLLALAAGADPASVSAATAAGAGNLAASPLPLGTGVGGAGAGGGDTTASTN